MKIKTFSFSLTLNYEINTSFINEEINNTIKEINQFE